jgi:hypothetical protein
LVRISSIEHPSIHPAFPENPPFSDTRLLGCGRGVKIHNSDIENGLAVPVNRSLFGLFFYRGFLKENLQPPFAIDTKYSVMPGLFGRGKTPQTGYAIGTKTALRPDRTAPARRRR